MLIRLDAVPNLFAAWHAPHTWTVLRSGHKYGIESFYRMTIAALDGAIPIIACLELGVAHVLSKIIMSIFIQY